MKGKPIKNLNMEERLGMLAEINIPSADINQEPSIMFQLMSKVDIDDFRDKVDF